MRASAELKSHSDGGISSVMASGFSLIPFIGDIIMAVRLLFKKGDGTSDERSRLSSQTPAMHGCWRSIWLKESKGTTDQFCTFSG